MKQHLIAWAVALLLNLGVAGGVWAQQSKIEGTIGKQIEAFKADDFAQAFTFATPTLRRYFQSPENFRRMVTHGYPMVWRPAEVQYLELAEAGGAWWQKVQIIDQKGFSHLLLYRMVETDEGWRIGGVQLLKQADATV